MPLFNVTVTKETTMVVEAEDADHACEVARDNQRQAFDDDGDAGEVVHVTGEVTALRHLKNGWDGLCIPYGGDGSCRLKDMIS